MITPTRARNNSAEYASIRGAGVPLNGVITRLFVRIGQKTFGSFALFHSISLNTQPRKAPNIAEIGFFG